MTNLQEVPTDELLSFQDYPAIHNPNSNSTISLSSVQVAKDDTFQNSPGKIQVNTEETNSPGSFSNIFLYMNC